MADLSSNPARLNLTIYHGRTDLIRLNWPSDALDGRGPWTATVTGPEGGTVDPIDLPVTVAGDVMELAVPALDKSLADVTLSVSLIDDDRVEAAGRFTVDTLPGPTVVDGEVHLDGDNIVDVTVAPPPVPAPPPTIELALAEITDGPDPSFSVGGFLALTPVPGMTVTVPDVDRPVYIHCEALVNHTGAPANAGVAIAPPDSSALGDQVAIGPAYVAADSATSLMSSDCWHRLPPNSPGDWQMHLWAGTAGDITLRVDSAGTPRIRAMQA